jgi:hypothetical protein
LYNHQRGCHRTATRMKALEAAELGSAVSLSWKVLHRRRCSQLPAF